MGYIYKADVYCDDCGGMLRASLQSKPEDVPVDVLDHYSYDSDDYPKEADIENKESDYPQHCAACHVFLQNPLTSEGYDYVKEKLNETGMQSIYQGNVSISLKEWATWYNFTYWTAEDCADDSRHATPGWYSSD